LPRPHGLAPIVKAAALILGVWVLLGAAAGCQAVRSTATGNTTVSASTPADATLTPTQTAPATSMVSLAPTTEPTNQPTATPATTTAAVTPAATTRSTTTAGTTAPTAPATKETGPAVTRPTDARYQAQEKRDLLILMLSYRDDVSGVVLENGFTYMTLNTGGKIIYDDYQAKSEDERLTTADLQDSLAEIYPLAACHTIRPAGEDPGRARSYAFLNAIYGSSQSRIRANLVQINFGPESLAFNKRAHAANQLVASGEAAVALIDGQPALNDFVFPTSGTFNYRVIAGTDRLSPHAYGLAIDLHPSGSDYWRSASLAAGQSRIANYPSELVALFEQRGFIWGGKWHHFDLCHYEYRPELILKARYFARDPDPAEPWYTGADLSDAQVASCIATIDASLP
jgi:hypothetical protein